MSTQHGSTREAVRGHAGSQFMEAAMLLGIGFYLHLTGFSGYGDSQLFIRSVDLVVWTFLVGGFCSLMAALACLTGRTWALLADAVIGGLIGAILLACGLYWLIESQMMGILVALVGLFDLNAAKGSWQNYRAVTLIGGTPDLMPESPTASLTAQPAAAPPDPQAKAQAMERLLASKQAAPPAPVSADLRPRKNEPPPDGFLAELGREQEPKAGT